MRACRLAPVDPLFHLFASYRHEDDVGHVGRALDHLRQRFRIGAVLQDVGLPPGTPLESLLHMVRTSRLVLAFIGPHWAVGPAGALRFDDEGDWVRREIAAAIAGNIPLLPNRYDVNAVVARLWQLAAQAGVAVESNAVTPLGGPVYNFEPL